MSVVPASGFGNYVIKGIEEISLPQPVSWLPQTLAWKILGFILLLLALYASYRCIRRWWHNRYRRAALEKLDALEANAGSDPLQVAAALPELLKAVALLAYPRKDVAALSGENWLNFLDNHYRGPSFLEGAGPCLLVLAYHPPSQWQIDTATAQRLIRMGKRWISKHKVKSVRAAHA